MDLLSFKDFLKEYRPKLLSYGGAMTLLAWFLFMLYYRLFQVRPFGAESHWSMFWTLMAYLPTAFVLLMLVYFFGSKNSPLKNTKYDALYAISRWLYIAFKNFIGVLLIAVIFIGAPQMKYYQHRVAEESGFENMTYYEQRSLFNLFFTVSDTESYDALPTENTGSPAILLVPGSTSSTSDSKDSESSNSSSSSDDNSWLYELIMFAIAMVAVFASLLYYLLLIWLSATYANFWLVAVPSIAVGMLTLAWIDVDDGPNQ